MKITGKRGMKRYMVFSGRVFYANGGALDFLESFDTLKEADEGARLLFAGIYCHIEADIDTLVDNLEVWWHVFDTVERKIVALHGSAKG